MTMRVSLLSNIMIFVNNVKLPNEDLDLNITSNLFSMKFFIFI